MDDCPRLTPASVTDLLTTGIHFLSRANSCTGEQSEIVSRLRISIIMDCEDDDTVLWSIKNLEKALHKNVNEDESDDEGDQR
jgi:hypothetical protein